MLSSSNIEILDNNYGAQYKQQQINYIQKIQFTNPQSNQAETKIQICIQKTNSTLGDKLKNLSKLKFMNILQPHYCLEETNLFFLIYPDVLQYSINEYNFNELKRGQGYRILLQLALIFAEFEKRKIDWPVNSIYNFYYIDGILYLSLIDYDFRQQQYVMKKPLEQFYQLIQQYFINDFPDLKDYKIQDNKFQILDYLLEKNGGLHKMNFLNPPYENVLKYFFQIQNLQSIYEVGNSVVKSFPTPNNLKLVQFELPEEVVYKSTKFQQSEFQNFILQNIDREIQLMELFTDSQQMAVCFLYLRIKQYSFLLQRKFQGALSKFQDQLQNATNENLPKIVENIAYKFSIALKNMHQENVIHRDLKPENLFVDNASLLQTQIYIADFDRSKQLENEVNACMTTLAQGNTATYDPPETEQTLKYDVFQYGLILLTIANRYNYIGELTGPRSLGAKYQQYYGKEAVQKVLQKYGYQQELIDLISQCLSYKYSERPTADEINKRMTTIYVGRKIRILKKSQTQDYYSDDSPEKNGNQVQSNKQICPQQVLQHQNFDNQYTQIPYNINNQYQKQGSNNSDQFVYNYNQQVNNSNYNTNFNNQNASTFQQSYNQNYTYQNNVQQNPNQEYQQYDNQPQQQNFYNQYPQQIYQQIQEPQQNRKNIKILCTQNNQQEQNQFQESTITQQNNQTQQNQQQNNQTQTNPKIKILSSTITKQKPN